MTVGLAVRGLGLVLLTVTCGRNPASRMGSDQAVLNPCNSGIVGLAASPDTASDPRIVRLGHQLFGDSRLSSDQTISCASCHQPERAFSDGRAVSIGVAGRAGLRNSPTLYNVAFLPEVLWDGRASSLEEQILLALTNPVEMDVSEGLLRQRLAADRALFEAVFGEAPSGRLVARAIASYLRTLLAGNTRVDRFLYCRDTSALGPLERLGLELFSGPANCVRCHVIAHESVHPFGGRVALFTDNRFHNIGVGQSAELGRAAVTNRPEDRGAFKTPTLRNVALTAPYMHDGSLKSLRQVVAFYNRGGVPNPNLDPSIRPLRLTEAEVDALVHFLSALTSPDAQANFAERGHM